MPDLTDLTPRFQTAYALARHADPDTRWALWQQHCGVAAVPPTPEGQALARHLLDAAWERYATLPADLSAEVQRLHSQAIAAETDLRRLFELGELPYRLVTFVGGFEGNAFVAGQALCVPVEMSADWASPVLTHELTHLAHQALGGSRGVWTRTLAALVVEEGLATRATDLLQPQAPLDWRIGDAEWLGRCAAVRPALCQAALAELGQDDDATLLRWTVQAHPLTGQPRAAYALGWWLVGDWLARGKTLDELARVPAPGLPALVRRWLRDQDKHNPPPPRRAGGVVFVLSYFAACTTSFMGMVTSGWAR